MFGEMMALHAKKFNYFSVLKSQLNFQAKGENESFLLGTVSREISISANDRTDLEAKEIETSSGIVPNEEITPVVEVEETVTEKGEVVSEEIPPSLPTTVIQANNLSESYNTIYKDVRIKNETNFNLSQEILTPNVEFTNKTDVIIFHTHTCESYTPTEKNSYVASRKLSNDRFELFGSKSGNGFR